MWSTLVFTLLSDKVSLLSWCRKALVTLYHIPQVELFEFKGEDLTEDEDGGIIRRIRTRGEGYARPNEGAIVEGKKMARQWWHVP